MIKGRKKPKLFRLVVLVTDDMLDAIDAQKTPVRTRADIVREAIERGLRGGSRSPVSSNSHAAVGVPA